MSALVIQAVSGAAGLEPTCFGEGELRACAVASRSLSILRAVSGGWPRLGPCVRVLEPRFRERPRHVRAGQALAKMDSDPFTLQWRKQGPESMVTSGVTPAGSRGRQVPWPPICVSVLAPCLQTPRGMACLSSGRSPLNAYLTLKPLL